MLRVLAFLLSLTISWHAAASERPLLVSGFDDILKQSDNRSWLRAALHFFKPDRGFAGMPTLVNALAEEDFYVLSGTSTWFETGIDAFLDQEHYRRRTLLLRDWLQGKSIEDFKIEFLRKILNEHSGRKVILLLDSSQASLNLASRLEGQFPNQILRIYIHQIQDRPVPANTLAYVSALDVAINEYQEGNLSEKDVRAVAESLLKEGSFESIIPDYAWCPKTNSLCKPSPLSGLCLQIQTQIPSVCSRSHAKTPLAL